MKIKRPEYKDQSIKIKSFIDDTARSMKKHFTGNEFLVDMISEGLENYILKTFYQDLLFMDDKQYTKDKNEVASLRDKIEEEYNKEFEAGEGPYNDITGKEWKRIIYWLIMSLDNSGFINIWEINLLKQIANLDSYSYGMDIGFIKEGTKKEYFKNEFEEIEESMETLKSSIQEFKKGHC